VTSYESNKDLHATGAEVAEFEDAVPARDDSEDEARNLPGSSRDPDGPAEIVDAARAEMEIPADETDEG
jgi:hypothetical protein